MNHTDSLHNETPLTPNVTSTSSDSLWYLSMRRVVLGLAFSLMPLNLLGLQYIVPTIGFLFVILGLRALRHHEPWFQRGFVLILPLFGFFCVKLILNASIYQSEIYDSTIFHHLQTLWQVGIILFLVCLWQGLKHTCLTIGHPSKAGSALVLLLWYGGLSSLHGLTLHGWIPVLTVLISYIVIIRKILALISAISASGYEIPSPTRHVSDGILVAFTLTTIAVGCGSCYFFNQNYPMEWQPQKTIQNQEIQRIQTELMQLGVPEHILRDLTQQELLSCDGALRMVINIDEGLDPHDFRDMSTKNLVLTSIALELPTQREHWKIIHHFSWKEHSQFHGTECIQLWTAYRRTNSWWSKASEVTGQLLYEQDDQCFTAPYYFLGEKTYTANSMFFGSQTSTDVFAAFSFPHTGTNHRGYLSYTIKELNDGEIIDSWINYCHQNAKRLANYPAQTAMDHRLQNTFHAKGFTTIQHALQFNPNANPLEPY